MNELPSVGRDLIAEHDRIVAAEAIATERKRIRLAVEGLLAVQFSKMTAVVGDEIVEFPSGEMVSRLAVLAIISKNDDEKEILPPCDWCDDPQEGWTLIDGWHIAPEDEYGLELRARIPCKREANINETL